MGVGGKICESEFAFFLAYASNAKEKLFHHTASQLETDPHTEFDRQPVGGVEKGFGLPFLKIN